MVLLDKKLGAMAEIASKDKMRYALNGINIIPEGETVRLQVSDGKRLMDVKYTPQADCFLFPVIAGVIDAKFEKALVNADDFRKAANGYKTLANVQESKFVQVTKIENNIKDSQGIETPSNIIQIAGTDRQSSGVKILKELEGNFPNVENITPKEKATMEIFFDADLLGDLLKTISKVHGGVRAVRVKMSLYGDGKVVKLEVKSDDTDIVALIMPMQ